MLNFLTTDCVIPCYKLEPDMEFVECTTNQHYIIVRAVVDGELHAGEHVGNKLRNKYWIRPVDARRKPAGPDIMACFDPFIDQRMLRFL